MSEEVEPFLFSMTAQGDKLVMSMTLLVIFIVGSHLSLSSLDKAVNNSAFREAVQSLYKELVIMGISSFILTLMSSGGLSLGSWLVYLVSS
jgi:hypothetical protein